MHGAQHNPVQLLHAKQKAEPLEMFQDWTSSSVYDLLYP